MADTAGRYRIASVPAGEYRARASFLGYEPAETTIVVMEGTEASVDFVLRSLVAPGPVMRDGVLGTIMGSVWEPLRRRPDRDPHPISETFVAQLHQEFASEGGNVIHSPLCVAAACGLLLRGARGETAREIAEMLQVDPDGTAFLSELDTLRVHLETCVDGQGDQWDMANGAWFDRGMRLRSDFVESVRSMPTDTVAALDFSGSPERGRGVINEWVRRQTHDRVPEILPRGSIGNLAVLVLANAVYLHARWLHAFSKSGTADEFFWIEGTDSTAVPTMQSTWRLPYGEVEGAQVIRLDYRGGEIGMVIVLPRERQGLDALERSLDAGTIAALRDSLALRLIELHMPRWKMEARWNLIPAMQHMGVSSAFSGARCDLSRAFEGEGLGACVSYATHVATVDVDEEGTEAAAAAAIVVTMSTTPTARSLPLHIDHPFLWWIQENTTGTILFMGRVVDPRSQGTGVTRQE
jgi:serpin B